jgi:hypothetical protein
MSSIGLIFHDDCAILHSSEADADIKTPRRARSPPAPTMTSSTGPTRVSPWREQA